MALGKPIKPIDLSQDVQKQIQSIARSRSLPHGLVRRAKIVLMAAEGLNNKTIGIQPHRQKHFKLSTDPFFIEKVL